MIESKSSLLRWWMLPKHCWRRCCNRRMLRSGWDGYALWKWSIIAKMSPNDQFESTLGHSKMGVQRYCVFGIGLWGYQAGVTSSDRYHFLVQVMSSVFVHHDTLYVVLADLRFSVGGLLLIGKQQACTIFTFYESAVPLMFNHTLTL